MERALATGVGGLAGGARRRSFRSCAAPSRARASTSATSPCTSSRCAASRSRGCGRGSSPCGTPTSTRACPSRSPRSAIRWTSLGLLAPNEAFLSLLLALHVPLGALFFFVLARRGASAGAARLAAAAPSSTRSAASSSRPSISTSTCRPRPGLRSWCWACCGCWRAAAVAPRRRRRSPWPWRSPPRVSRSSPWRSPRASLLGLRFERPLGAAGRLAAALALATALAAPVLVLVASQVEGSARGRGFPTEVVLAHSVHPFALVQTLVGSLFGNPANLANEWWGQNFFPRGFPYVLSLYLGAPVLALAAAGAASRRGPSRRLLLLFVVGLVLALGRWGGLTPLVEASAGAARVSLPGEGVLRRAPRGGAARRAWAPGAGRRGAPPPARARGLCARDAAGGLVAPARRAFPGPLASFAAAFFPPGSAPETRAALLDRILRDAATGGAVALAVALVAFVASRGRLSGSRAAWLAVALVTADLLRTGAGLNPMVSRSFYAPSPELAERLPLLREGRVYTCPIESEPGVPRGPRRARSGPRGVELRRAARDAEPGVQPAARRGDGALAGPHDARADRAHPRAGARLVRSLAAAAATPARGGRHDRALARSARPPRPRAAVRARAGPDAAGRGPRLRPARPAPADRAHRRRAPARRPRGGEPDRARDRGRGEGDARGSRRLGPRLERARGRWPRGAPAAAPPPRRAARGAPPRGAALRCAPAPGRAPGVGGGPAGDRLAGALPAAPSGSFARAGDPRPRAPRRRSRRRTRRRDRKARRADDTRARRRGGPAGRARRGRRRWPAAG